MDSKIIVTGGAGFLGRIAVEILLDAGFTPVILDNFSRGHRQACEGIETYEVELSDRQATYQTLKKIPNPSAIFHFAALALVNESTVQPELYFRNNVLSTLSIAECCKELKIQNIVHSSSCAVYGQPSQLPMTETLPFAPISPYGETKKIAEGILDQYAKTFGLKVVHLRYFNPVGAYKNWGERHEPETHFIPNLVNAILNEDSIPLYGIDYPTKDGTCIRDFIHVEDLIDAHIRAYKFLQTQKDGSSTAFNLGSGKGYSLREVFEIAEKIAKKKIGIEVHPRRAGDPPMLYAQIHKAESQLHWKPKKTISDMIQSDLNFRKNNRPLSHA